jgi:16S rRNA (guanine966-N2)-methyltransferase
MRITGGQARSRPLVSPKGLNIRPTSDPVKEAVFNIIGQDLSGLNVLDLFAGTGSLGLEALSRNALQVVFIDHSKQAINLIKKNLSLSGYLSSARVLRRDLRKGIPWNHPYLNQSFDLIFLDPPYGEGLVPLLLKELCRQDHLSPEFRVVAESSIVDNLPVSFGNIEMIDDRQYGKTRISIYLHRAKS